jgi:hypothetical protein
VIDRLVDEFGPKERPNGMEVHWLYGPTGTGKTRYVYEKHEDLYIKTRLNGGMVTIETKLSCYMIYVAQILNLMNF